MARKKHLINVHTSTGTTAPTNASLYLGEIAVQHTPNDPGLWIKMGTAESSTEYEKFIGETRISNEFHKTNHNIPYVVTNETGTTARLHATCNEIDQLTEGQSIILHLTCGTTTGSTDGLANSCAIDLTLSDGSQTGYKIIYYGGTTKLTTHYGGGNDIRLTYHENLTIGTTTGLTGWWVEGNYYSDGNYNVGNLYERRYAGDRLTRYQIIGVGEDERLYPLTKVDSGDYNTGTTKPVNTIGFRPERFFYRNTTAIVAANAVETAQVDYQSIYFSGARYTFNSDLAAYRAIYLRGSYDESENLFYLNTGLTTFYTQVPTNTANITLSDYFVKGDYYIYLGATYSNINYLQLDANHELFYFDGTNLVKAWSNKILGPAYSYSGLPYVNSATTLADAYSALTNEMLEDEKVVATALNDLNDRIDEISAATGDNAELLEYLQENEEVVAGALNNLNERVGTVETHMTGDYIPITGYQTATGTTEEELTLTDEDTVNKALGKLQKQMLDNEESIAAGLNDLNTRLENVDDIIAHNTGVTQLSGAVRSFSAATYYEFEDVWGSLNQKANDSEFRNVSGATRALSSATQSLSLATRALSSATQSLSSATQSLSSATRALSSDTQSLSSATRALSSATISLSGAVMGISAKTSGVLTVNLNGVLQGRYSPSASTTINLTAATEVTGADVLLTGYELATGTTEEELAIVATDTVNEAFGKIQKQNYDNEAVVAGALNDLDERTIAISGTVETVSGVVETIQANYVTAITSASTNSEYPTAKAVYDEVHPAIITTGGTAATITIEPNVLYNFGALTGTKTFTLATPGDSSVVNHYYWTFDTSATAPTITWPTGLTWYGGSAPTLSASKHYEISVLNGIAISMEV